MTAIVHLCVWSGDGARARELVSSRYAGGVITELPYRKLRISGLGDKIRLLRGLRGRAIVFYFESLRGFKHRQVLQCFQLLHRCRETVLCDQSGLWESFYSSDIFRSGPTALLSVWRDARSAAFWWFYLRFWRKRALPIEVTGSSTPRVAYLIPNLANMGTSGGAISHIRGFLHGMKNRGIACRVFSGTRLAQNAYKNEVIAATSRPYFFWGAVMLSYNLVFAREVGRRLAGNRPSFFYQRHCAFAIAGALLSHRFKIPLILEYNGSEEWIAQHWDPNPLRDWIKLCEEVTLRSAARIVVVSGVLRDDLISRGIETNRIRLNPNAVDADFFYPGRGRETGRRELEVQPKDVLIGFAGSFSLWHGIEVLERAITSLLSSDQPVCFRFVLMGDGLLHAELRSALAAYEKERRVIFTGSIPQEKVVEYLDASDILVSPHIPMPDGSRFFGSPTKLFEYMAMGKAIIASRLDQLAEVLEHDRTAVLVTPGDAAELALAILQLATNPEKCASLGAAARRAAVERHGWSTNVAIALNDCH